MKKLELERHEINDIINSVAGDTSVSVETTLKLAAAAGSILEVFGDEQGELLSLISGELTIESADLLVGYAINLYMQQST